MNLLSPPLRVVYLGGLMAGHYLEPADELDARRGKLRVCWRLIQQKFWVPRREDYRYWLEVSDLRPKDDRHWAFWWFNGAWQDADGKPSPPETYTHEWRELPCVAANLLRDTFVCKWPRRLYLSVWYDRADPTSPHEE